MNEVPHHSELMMLASQIYVRMRRCNGRVVDAVYMVKNEDYAREILDLAMQQTDTELQMLASRYEGWLEPAQAPLPVVSLPVIPPVELPVPVLTLPVKPGLQVVEKLPVAAVMAEPAHLVTEEEVAQHYIGALR
jgi:hypothetical protein